MALFSFSIRFSGLLPGLLALTVLGACSDEKVRSENSEMRVDAPDTTTETRSTATAVGKASIDDSEATTGPLTGQGARYRVAVETAYFFDKPEQSTPNGRYLRRGDTFYGQGESNGFVKTEFVQPNGVSGTAWLKLPELRKLAGTAAPTVARSTRPVRPATPAPRPATPAPRPATQPAPVPETTYEAESQAETPAVTATPATPARGKAAVVEVPRAYFYDSPNLSTPRRAFCQQGDKVRLVDSRGEAVYVTFTNWEKVTTTGWMKRSELRFL
jgi:hypothetical protein